MFWIDENKVVMELTWPDHTVKLTMRKVLDDCYYGNPWHLFQEQVEGKIQEMFNIYQ